MNKKMKLAMLIFVMQIIPHLIEAKIPHTISYQGMLTDNNGQSVADGEYMLSFKLTNSPNNNIVLWEETHVNVAIVNGIFNTILGSVTPLDLPFDEPYWLEISVNGGDVLMPLIELTSAAYSLNAASVTDSAVTSAKIAQGHVVRSINGLTDHLRLVGGPNVSVVVNADSIVISADSAITAVADSDWTISGNDIYTMRSGNVGIGESMPQAKLHVAGNIKANGVVEASSFTGNGGNLNFSQDSNMQPYLTINYIIALEGIFPSRPLDNQQTTNGAQGLEPYIGEITMFAGTFAPRGWAFCEGQLMSIAQYTALFSLVGTTYGGDGRTTFALPDLRGRAPIHQGQGPGLSNRRLGQQGGSENIN